MLSTKSVLPNFLKSLVVTAMTLSSVSAFAGHHEKGEEKIGDLKEMSSDAKKIKAEDMTDEMDAAVIDKEMTEEAKKMMDGKANEMSDTASEAKPEY